MNHRHQLAIIGSGASAIYLLKHLLDEAPFLSHHLEGISIFERSSITGMGMPYSPETTDRYNMSNISSEELPPLPVTFGDWLRAQDRELLLELGVEASEISDSQVYSRLALGRYFSSQYHILISRLEAAGITVAEFPGCEIVDVRPGLSDDGVLLVTANGTSRPFGRLVIATGHCWVEDDCPENGYYASPWPISKLLPPAGEHHDFTIGTLGASLSAFDVISSLAHRHGEFVMKSGVRTYIPAPGTDGFRITMHSVQGLLPHLQFDQEEPFREIYRHVSREEMLALIGDDGFLRLDRYFDRVCRPALTTAFAKEKKRELVSQLENPEFGFKEFVEQMTEKHDYVDSFDGMRREMTEARRSVEGHRPIHWKEVIDDLMYTLNFHADLLPAEDHLTLRSTVLPFVMNVVAAMPLPSAEMVLALHDAGKLDILSGRVEVAETHTEGRTSITLEEGDRSTALSYRMFIDCSGQKPLELDEYPFPTLVKSGSVRRARSRFSDPREADNLPEEKKDHLFRDELGVCYHTGGVDIDAAFRLIDSQGNPDSRLYDIALPHISGARPYSYGLQACGDMASILVKALVEELKKGSVITGDTESLTKIYESVSKDS